MQDNFVQNIKRGMQKGEVLIGTKMFEDDIENVKGRIVKLRKLRNTIKKQIRDMNQLVLAGDDTSGVIQQIVKEFGYGDVEDS
jgi:hypothetical protein